MTIGFHLETEDFGSLSKPFKFRNVSPKDITLVFECDDCKEKETDDPSNVVYSGAPICPKCLEEMSLSRAEVLIK